jgi:predicted RNase H-like HicB family nuclease
MNVKKYTYWQDENMWIGFFSEFPDYMTQGESLDELKENLKDIYHELSSGNIPCVRRVDELEVA